MTVADLYPLESADPDCIDPDAAIEVLRTGPWRRLAVLGDSVAAGIREPAEGYRDESFADRTGEALLAAHEGAAYRNLAQRDLRIAQIHDGQLADALAFRPDLAIVVAGGNDALSRRYDPAAVHGGLTALLTPLRDAGAQVVTIGLFDLARSGIVPVEYAEPMVERFDQLDDVTRAVAAEVGALHVDTHHHPRASDPGIFASDRMHATARGHAIAFAAIIATLAEEIRRSEQ